MDVVGAEGVIFIVCVTGKDVWRFSTLTDYYWVLYLIQPAKESFSNIAPVVQLSGLAHLSEQFLL